LFVDSEEARPLLPRFDTELGKYVWEKPEPVALEPAFVREALESVAPVPSLDPDATNVTVRTPVGVTTFADAYPRGTRGHAETDAPVMEEADPLAEWRIAADVADDILISLPEGTPKMVRQFLTLLMSAMRSK
jgi:hypothetical protein